MQPSVQLFEKSGAVTVQVEHSAEFGRVFAAHDRRAEYDHVRGERTVLATRLPVDDLLPALGRRDLDLRQISVADEEGVVFPSRDQLLVEMVDFSSREFVLHDAVELEGVLTADTGTVRLVLGIQA